MDSRIVIASAEPFFSLGLVPERSIEAPALPPIVTTEESTGYRPGPQATGPIVACTLETPDELQSFRGRVVAPWIFRDRDFGKALGAVVGSVKLRTEVA